MTGTKKDGLAVLKGARDLLAKSENWTKNAAARPYRGGPTMPALSATATCWCLSGAITWVAQAESIGKVAIEGTTRAQSKALGLLAATIRNGHPSCGDMDALTTVVNFNDAYGRQHPDVLRVLDAAIERAEA